MKNKKDTYSQRTCYLITCLNAINHIGSFDLDGIVADICNHYFEFHRLIHYLACTHFFLFNLRPSFDFSFHNYLIFDCISSFLNKYPACCNHFFTILHRIVLV